MERQPCVYLLASKPNGTLYAGVTSNLVKRVWEHKQHLVEGFTRTYGVDRLVWYEVHESMISAISREKAIKNWKRAWKVKTIETMNPEWRDLYEDLVGDGSRHAPG
jgi:putative endonuclease